MHEQLSIFSVFGLANPPAAALNVVFGPRDASHTASSCTCIRMPAGTESGTPRIARYPTRAHPIYIWLEALDDTHLEEILLGLAVGVDGAKTDEDAAPSGITEGTVSRAARQRIPHDTVSRPPPAHNWLTRNRSHAELNPTQHAISATHHFSSSTSGSNGSAPLRISLRKPPSGKIGSPT